AAPQNIRPATDWEMAQVRQARKLRRGWLSRSAPDRRGFVPEQPDLEIARAVDHRTVRFQPAVGDAKHQLGAHHPLDIEPVHDLLDAGQNLTGEFQLA